MPAGVSNYRPWHFHGKSSQNLDYETLCLIIAVKTLCLSVNLVSRPLDGIGV